MPPTIRFDNGTSAAVLILSGKVIAEDNGVLREHIEKTLRSAAPVKAIDLTDVEFLDSYALGQIIYYCTNPDGKRGNIFIVNRRIGGGSYIERLIKISELQQIFTIVDSIEAAISGGSAAGS
jgi:anti-anti-sigma factor